jgi:hypothetical protein
MDRSSAAIGRALSSLTEIPVLLHGMEQSLELGNWAVASIQALALRRFTGRLGSPDLQERARVLEVSVLRRRIQCANLLVRRFRLAFTLLEPILFNAQFKPCSARCEWQVTV